MNIEEIINQALIAGIPQLYGKPVSSDSIQLQKTKREFEGDITLVVFPLLGISRKAPEITGQVIGAYLQEHVREVVAFNVVKGFLNPEGIVIFHTASGACFKKTIEGDDEYKGKKR